MAQEVRADHHERLLTMEDLLDFLPLMIKLQDEPIADPVCVPVYYVSKLARENGVIVCQVGEGADELFWGYPGWKQMLELQRWDDVPVPAFSNEQVLGAACAGKESGTEVRIPSPRLAGATGFLGRRGGLHRDTKERLLSPRLARQFHGLTRGRPSSRSDNALRIKPGRSVI